MEPITADTLLQGVRSFSPGRLRLRLPLLRGASDEFVGMIRDADREGRRHGRRRQPRVGSLLTWDPAVLTLEPQALAEEAAGMLEMARMMGVLRREGRVLRREVLRLRGRMRRRCRFGMRLRLRGGEEGLHLRLSGVRRHRQGRARPSPGGV